MIFAYSKPDRQNIIATQFAYKRILNSKMEIINNRSNCFRCGVKDIQSYIEVTIKPIEEDFQGELKVIYGPIELDNLTKDKYMRAKKELNFQIECHGKADNKKEFTLLCFNKDFIIAKDANLIEIKRMKIVPGMMIVSNSVNPEKLKILLPALNSELALDFDQVRDKDVAVLLLEHKKKLIIEGKSNLLRNPGLPDDFRIEKTSNNHLVLGKGMGDNSLNDTFRDNLHSLTDLLKESKKDKSVSNNRGVGKRTNPVQTKVVFKEVDSREDIREDKQESLKQRRPQNKRYKENVITFNPEPKPESIKREQVKRNIPHTKENQPIEMRNPYYTSSKKKLLFNKEENILDDIRSGKQEPKKINYVMDDISEELLNFDGYDENEMDKMINQVFKKEKVEVQRYGSVMKESAVDAQLKKMKETDSFFDDVEFSKDYNEIPVQNFNKRTIQEPVRLGYLCVNILGESHYQ